MQDQPLLKSYGPPVIAVVIPAYKVLNQIRPVLENIGPEVSYIFVIDDCCPEKTGKSVQELNVDNRVKVLFHDRNLGVGGAVMTGYREALFAGSDIIVKIDGDGQMNPELIPELLDPILKEEADYSKGNRFFNIENVRSMPSGRIIGNLGLSFFSKMSSGYWNIFDPNNGFTAIDSRVLTILPLEKISNRYFFESDMLFRLNLLNAKVVDIPMVAKYGNEKSNLKPLKSIFEFSAKHLKNLIKRIFFNYYLRDFNLASIELPLGVSLLLFGIVQGFRNWIHSMHSQTPTQTGTLILIALAILTGLQLVLSFLSYDISKVPPIAIAKSLNRIK